jgi:hypothetical protein
MQLIHDCAPLESWANGFDHWTCMASLPKVGPLSAQLLHPVWAWGEHTAGAEVRRRLVESRF